MRSKPDKHNRAHRWRERYDLRELYHIYRVYETKKQRIQKLSKFKPKTSKRA